MPTAVQNATARLKQPGFEGLSRFMYFDSGQVATGYGHKVLKTNLSKIEFRLASNGTTKATQAQKEAEWDAALSNAAAKALVLGPGEADRLIDDDIGEAERLCTSRFAAYPTFPQPAQEALLDMAFNLGAPKFSSTNWPALFKAVSAGEWTEASTQCHRTGIGAIRNDKIRDLFLEAAGRFQLEAASMDRETLAARVLSEVQTALEQRLEHEPRYFPQGVNYLRIEVNLGPSIGASIEVKGP